MNSLFPGGGVGSNGVRLGGPNPPNPYGGDITPPAMPAQIDFNELMRSVGAENNAERTHEMVMANNRPMLSQIADKAIGSGGQPVKPPLNYLPPNYISPLDQAKLDVQRRGQDIQEKLGTARVGVADEGLDVKREGIASQEKLGQSKLDVQKQIGEGKLDVEQSKLKLADWKAKNPDGKIVQVKGGNIHVIDPQTGEAIDTGVPSGTMTDKDMIAAKGNEARQTKATVPGRAPVNSTADLPTQQKVGQTLKAQELINTHPEWKNFIKIDPNSGLVIVTPPGNSFLGMGGGPDKAVYDQITSALYPKQSTQPTKPVETKPSTEQVMEKTQRNPTTGATRKLTSKDGGKTWMDDKGNTVK